MDLVLDDELLNGAQAMRAAVRPTRWGCLVPFGNDAHAFATMELNCQLWGGAAFPLIPLDSTARVLPLYRDLLVGSAIDNVYGLDLHDGSVGAPIEEVAWPAPRIREDLAVAMLRAGRQATYRPVTVVELSDDDPWRLLYAACLGYMPARPSASVIEAGGYIEDLTFEHFINVNRQSIRGSAEDLLDRLADPEAVHPRNLAMFNLGYGLVPSSGIRGANPLFVDDRVTAWDAGPNIVVLCTRDDVADATLVWNLRAAHGDRYVAPVGILVEQFDPAQLQLLIEGHGISRNGIAAHQLYFTSTSLSVDDITNLLPAQWLGGRTAAVVNPGELVDLGPAPTRERTEVGVWSNGSATIIPLTAEDDALITRNGSRFGRTPLRLDLRLLDSPFPDSARVRARSFSDEFYAGGLSRRIAHASTELNVRWPARMLMLKVVADSMDLSVQPSAAGVACMTFLESIQHGVLGLDRLAHAPVLDLLQEMAERQGTAWAKAHGRVTDGSSAGSTAPSEDDLPEVAFDRIRLAVGSTKAARSWLDWAEPSGLIIKGFQVECDRCRAKQWLPISGFRPPLACRGCGRTISRPFPKESVAFRYRLGEAIRRVYEHDAIGHLLTARFFALLFGRSSSSIIGVHPGIDVRTRGSSTRLGEADVIVLRRNGGVVPVEVKRSFAGVMAVGEIDKLDALVAGFSAPWSVVAVPAWASTAPEGVESLASRNADGTHKRMVLTYDQLLDTTLVWNWGSDPFAWKVLTPVEIEERQARWTGFLEARTSGPSDPLETGLLFRPGEETN